MGTPTPKVKNPVKALQRGGVLLPNPAREAPAMHGMRTEPPDGVQVGTTSRDVWACDAFTAEELELRLRHYQQRAEQGLPLFEDGPPVLTGGAKRIECWACSCVGTVRDMMIGDWHQRKHKESNECELYCPACFARSGWGAEDDEGDSGE